MIDWLNPLQTILATHSKAVLVTVVAVNGSVPREIGATLIVSANNQAGTIGGGNLEYAAISHARTIITNSTIAAERSMDSGTDKLDIECQRMSLGPSLGQCCGGRVELLYECVTTETGWLKDLLAEVSKSTLRDGSCLYRCLGESENCPKAFIAVPTDGVVQAINPVMSAGVSTSVVDGTRWFCLPLKQDTPNIWVFGAGHVGQAVVAQLSLLPCRITWLDHREEWLSYRPELEIVRILTDTPGDEIDSAPTNAHFVVMTHSHALDFDICHAVLLREQFAWLGLIGSATKRQTFNKRLSQRGVDDNLIQQIRCPIGSLLLQSSLPAMIALDLVAELATFWQRDVHLANC